MVRILVEVEDGKDLPVVGNESFSNCLGASDESLENLESDRDDSGVSSIQGGLDGDDQLRDDWEHSGLAVLEKLEDSLDGEESVRILLFSESFEEDGQVVMVVKFCKVHVVDPLQSASSSSVLHNNWEVSSIVVSSEFRELDVSLLSGSSLWFCNASSFSLLIETEGLSPDSGTLLQHWAASNSQAVWIDLLSLWF